MWSSALFGVGDGPGPGIVVCWGVVTGGTTGLVVVVKAGNVGVVLSGNVLRSGIVVELAVVTVPGAGAGGGVGVVDGLVIGLVVEGPGRGGVVELVTLSRVLEATG